MKKLFAFLALLLALLASPPKANADTPNYDFTNNSNPKYVGFIVTNYNGNNASHETGLTWDSTDKLWYLNITPTATSLQFSLRATPSGWNDGAEYKYWSANVYKSPGYDNRFEWAINNDTNGTGDSRTNLFGFNNLDTSKTYRVVVKAHDTGDNKNQADCWIEELNTWTVYAVAESAPTIWIWANSNSFNSNSYDDQETMTAVPGYTNLYSFTYTGPRSDNPTNVRFNKDSNNDVTGTDLRGHVIDLTNSYYNHASLDNYVASLRTVTSVSLMHGTDVVKANVLGSGNAWSANSLSSHSNYAFKVYYNTGDPDYYYFTSTVSANSNLSNASLKKGDSSSSFALSGNMLAIKDLYVTEDNGTFKVNATIIKKLYITGDFESWKPGDPTQFAFDGTDYVTTIAGAGKFKISTSTGDWQAFNNNAKRADLAKGEWKTLSTGTSSMSFPSGATGDWVVKVNAAYTQIYVDSSTPTPTVPTNVYIWGNKVNGIGDANWDQSKFKNDTYKMTKDADANVWRKSGVAFGNSGDNWFSFFGQDDTKYAPAGDSDVAITVNGAAVTLTSFASSVDPKALKVTGGTYDVEFDWNDGAPKVKLTTPAPSFPATLYLDGRFNNQNWITNKACDVSGSSTGVYKWNNVVMTNNQGEFVIKDGSGTFYVPSSGGNVQLNDMSTTTATYLDYTTQSSQALWQNIKTATYDIEIDLNAGGKVKLTPVTEPATIPTNVYIWGNQIDGVSTWDVSLFNNDAFKLTKDADANIWRKSRVKFDNLSTNWFGFIDGADRKWAVPSNVAIVVDGAAQSVQEYEVSNNTTGALAVDGGEYDVEFHWNNGSPLVYLKTPESEGDATRKVTFYVNNSQHTGYDHMHLYYTIGVNNDHAMLGSWPGGTLGSIRNYTINVVETTTSDSHQWKYVVTVPSDATALTLILSKGNNGSDHLANGIVFNSSTDNNGKIFTVPYGANKNSEGTWESVGEYPKVEVWKHDYWDGGNSLTKYCDMNANEDYDGVYQAQVTDKSTDKNNRYVIRVYTSSSSFKDYVLSGTKNAGADVQWIDDGEYGKVLNLAEKSGNKTIATGENAGCYFSVFVANNVATKLLPTKSAATDAQLQKLARPGGDVLNVYPRIVRQNNNDWSYWDADVPVVYVTAEYLNSNRIVPDWEMDNLGDGKYQIKGATLRGIGIDDGKLTANVIYKNGTKVTYTTTPAGLESGDFEYGRTYTLDLDLNKASNQFTATLETNIPSYIGLVGSKYKQEKAGSMPNTNYTNHNTDNGWQESWVLYENGNPMRDIDGNYIYSTQWPPMSEIFFLADNGTENIKIKSNEMTMTMAVDDKGKPVIKEGKVWKNGVTGLDLDDNTKYAHYTIQNSWVFGPTKIWTGWGSLQAFSDNKWRAEWDHNINWGFGNEKADDSGSSIEVANTYKLERNAGNFKFDHPTYFKTIEFFLPVTVDDEDVPTPVAETTADATKARFYTTLAIGEASILAKEATINGAIKPNTGQYKVVMKGLPDNAKMIEWKVTRYDAVKTNTKLPREQWVEAGTLEDEDDTVIIGGYRDEGDNLVETGKVTYRRSEGDAVFNTEDKVLDNGRYFYVFDYTFEDPNQGNIELTDYAMSNPFTILDTDKFSVNIVPLQLLELSEELQTTHGAKYLTYREPGKSNTYYLVGLGTDDDEHRCKNIDATTARAIIADNDNFKWTSDFFVIGFVADDYYSAMETLISDGLIKSYMNPVEVKLSKGTSESHEALKSAVRSSNRVYGRVDSRGGSLDEAKYYGEMRYNYTMVDKETHEPNVVSTNEGDITPVVPNPYYFTYEYKYDGEVPSYTDLQDADKYPEFAGKDYLKVTVPSGIDKVDGVGQPKTVLVPIKDLDPRTLDCVLQFKRPNISDEIFDAYEVHYSVKFTSSDPTTTIDGSGIYADKDNLAQLTGGGTGLYQFKIKEVNPENAAYPVMEVVKTEYKAVAGKPGTTDLVAKYGKNLKVEAKNHAKRESGKIGQIFLGYLAPGQSSYGHLNESSNLYDWMYKGHTEFSNTDVVHEPQTPEDKSDVKGLSLKPQLFMVETYLPDQTSFGDDTYACYEYVVKHNHESNWPATITPDDINNPATDSDPLRFTFIAKGFSPVMKNGQIQHPNVVFTPVYVYFHDVASEQQGTAHADTPVELEKTGELSNPDPAPRRNAPVMRDLGNGESGLDPDPTLAQPMLHINNTNMNASNVISIDAINADSSSAHNYVAVSGGPTDSKNAANQDDNTTTGIENVAYGVSDGDVEYYNIQGVKVENPMPGQVYIVKQGSQVSKQLMK